MSGGEHHQEAKHSSSSKGFSVRSVLENGVGAYADLANEAGVDAITKVPNSIKDLFGAGGGETKGHGHH